MENNKTKLMEILDKLGIKNITKKEINKLVEMYGHRTDLNIVEKEMDLLHALNKVLIGTYSRVCVENMMKICDDIDNDLLLNLFFLYENIKNRGYTGIDCLSEFSKASYQILLSNKKTNLIVKKILFDEFDKVESIKNVLYFGIEDKEKADKLFANCLKRSKLFLSQCDSKNLLTIINCLKNNFDFTDNELVEISSKCATFFAFSSASKISNLDRILKEFKEFIRNGLVDMKASSKVYKLLDRDYKEVLLNSATIASANTKFVSDTIRFLMGENIGSINKDASVGAINIKGNFTPAQLAKIYNNSITSLSIGVEKISEVSLNVNDIYKKIYSRDLDLTKLINGRNFTGLEQLTRDDYDFSKNNKIEEIFKLLSPFFNDYEFEKLLQNNLSFLIANVDEVKIALKEAILSSKDSNEMKKNILHKISNHFDRYQNQFSDIKREEGISVDKANKVYIRDLNEENIIEFLSKINVNEEEIEKWKKDFNKEVRELRIVELEVDLENILSQLEDLELLIPFGFTNKEEFVQENNVVRGLLFDLHDKYRNLDFIKPSTKNIRELAKKINDKIDTINEKLNSNYDFMISIYKQEIAKMSDNLSLLNNRMIKYRADLNKLMETNMELLSYKEQNFTLSELKKKLEHANSSVKELGNIRKKANEYEKKAKEYINKFSDIMDRETSFINQNSILCPNRYKSVSYMKILFVNSLINEELVDPTELSMKLYSMIDESDKDKKYEEFRKLLDPKLLIYSDMVVEFFRKALITSQKEHRNVILNSINFYGLDIKGDESNNELCAMLDSHVKGLDEIYEKIRRLEDLKQRLDTIDENKVDELYKEIEDLENNIKLVNESIDYINSKKIVKK